MKLKNIIFYPIFLFVFLGAAQSSLAQSSGHLTHTIKSGETLSALASKYRTTVGDIMRLNGMNSNSILKLGAKIKIPASNKSSSSQAAPKPAATTPAATSGNAVTHTVKKGESLYKISKDYNVSQAQLMQMNGLSNHNLKIGQVIIVGGNKTAAASVSSNATTNATKTPVQTENRQAAEEADSATDDSPFTLLDNKTVSENKPALEKPQEPVTSAPVASTPVSAPARTETSNTANIAPEGYFTAEFAYDVEGRSLQTKTGTAMSFKTASGWADKKYYVLMNDVPPGSIVKISAGGKTVYAKVLWNLGDMKENEGLDFRISNAAASALGISDPKFQITVSFFE